MSDSESKIDDVNDNNIITYAILKTLKNVISITKLPFYIGRNSSCNLIIDNSSISKNHATISFDETTENFVITDTSSNGTYVNEVKISKNKINLYTNDTLRFGNDKNIYIFEKMSNNEETVIYPNTNQNNENKISLVNLNSYQPSKINHLFGENTFQNNNNLNNNNKNELIEENEKLKLEITNLKDALNEQEKNYLINVNNKLDDLNEKIIYNNTINQKEINNNHDMILFKKIKNELIPNWQDMSNEELEEKCDIIIENYKKKNQFNEIILSLESQYNNEVTNFNYVLQKYDKKLQEVFKQIELIFQGNSNDKRELSNKYLLNQLNDLINQRERNLMTINKLKGEIIKLQTEFNIEKTKNNKQNYIKEQRNNENIKILNKKLGKLENQLKNINKNSIEQSELHLNKTYSQNLFYPNQNNIINQTNKMTNYNTQPINFTNRNNMNLNYLNKNDSPSFNKFFVDTLNELNQKNKQIDVLNSKINKITSKYTIDAMNIYKDVPNFQNREEYKINTIPSNDHEKENIILENVMDNNRFEEIVRQKEALFKNK
jgi:hypothetical protein